MSGKSPPDDQPSKAEPTRKVSAAAIEKIDNAISNVVSTLAKNESPSASEKDKKKSLWSAGTCDDGYSSYTSTPKSVEIHCCWVSAADKGRRVYPLDSRFDAAALYSECTPDICSKVNNVFRNSCTYQIINQNSAHLLPPTSSVTVTSSSESQPPILLMDTAPATHLIVYLCYIFRIQ
ncbi:transporter [Trichonephila clavipes]|nr:transporter [Trichonephila clavipes]